MFFNQTSLRNRIPNILGHQIIYLDYVWYDFLQINLSFF